MNIRLVVDAVGVSSVGGFIGTVNLRSMGKEVARPDWEGG